MKLSREFHFNAAHRLEGYDDDHPNRRVHGHSFRARITLEGAPDAHGRVMDFDAFGAALEAARGALDHRMLNDIAGLETPTLENICLWLWQTLRPELPHLSRVEIYRDNLGQSCLYEGE